MCNKVFAKKVDQALLVGEGAGKLFLYKETLHPNNNQNDLSHYLIHG